MTGIDSFANPGDIGPIYPFVGTEVALAIVGIVLWIAWHVLQNRDESREWVEAEEAFDEALLPGSVAPPEHAPPAAAPSSGPRPSAEPARTSPPPAPRM